MHDASRYLGSLDEAQAREQGARKELVAMAQRASLADELIQENDHLRELLQLRDRLTTPGTAAEVVYDSPDLYTRRVVIDRGQVDGIAQGSPVLDEKGVVGQVTRVYPLRSEVTLLIDRDQAIPVSTHAPVHAAWPMATRRRCAPAASSCASCPAMPMCRKATC